VPLCEAISFAAMSRIDEFDPQGISGMSWSLSQLQFSDRPLLNALSAASLSKISQYGAQEIANISWAYAKMK